MLVPGRVSFWMRFWKKGPSPWIDIWRAVTVCCVSSQVVPQLKVDDFSMASLVWAGNTPRISQTSYIGSQLGVVFLAWDCRMAFSLYRFANLAHSPGDLVLALWSDGSSGVVTAFHRSLKALGKNQEKYRSNV